MSNTTPSDALAAFEKERGKAVSQNVIQDEHGFTLSDRLAHEPITALSHRCCLNLRFAYERTQSTGVAGEVAKATDATLEGSKGAVRNSLSYVSLKNNDNQQSGEKTAA